MSLRQNTQMDRKCLVEYATNLNITALSAHQPSHVEKKRVLPAQPSPSEHHCPLSSDLHPLDWRQARQGHCPQYVHRHLQYGFDAL